MDGVVPLLADEVDPAVTVVAEEVRRISMVMNTCLPFSHWWRWEVSGS